MAGDRERLQKLRRLKELRAKVAAPTPVAPEKPYSPTDDMSGMGKFAAGVGSGATRVARRAANLAMSEKPQSSRFAGLDLQRAEPKPEDWYSDESVRDQSQRDAPLGNTGAGMAGQFVGEMAATAPLGAVGTSVRTAAGAARAAPALARTLGVGAEGAAQGVVTSDVGAAGKGAGIGAGIAGAFGAGGKVLNRALQGIVRKSPEAEMMETIAARHGEDVKLPLAQAASDEGVSGMLKMIYGKILPFVPGATKQLKAQGEEAGEKFRNVALKEAAPPGVEVLPDSGKDVHGSMKVINDAFEKAYMDLGKDSSLRTNLLRTKINLQRLAQETGDDAFLAPLNSVEDLLKADFVKGSAEDLARYEALADPWENFLRVRKAAARTKTQGGRFSATELRNAGKAMEGDRTLSQGKGKLQDLAEVGEQTVGRESKAPGFIERSLAWGGLGGLGYLSPVGAAAMWGTGKALGSKAAQNTLMGDTTMQRAIIKMLRDKPEMANMLRSGVQGATIAEGNDDGS